MKITKKSAWRIALCWVAVIYSTLYIVRPICEYLKANTPFTLLSNIFMVGLLGTVVIVLVKKVKFKKPSTYVLLALALLCYGLAMIDITYPEEKLHLIEYGLLGFLIYTALRFDFSIGRSYLLAFILTAIFGWLDEGIQHILPNRYYQTEDVILNAVSGLLGLFLTYIFERERNMRDGLLP